MKELIDFRQWVLEGGYDSVTTISMLGIIDDYMSINSNASPESRNVRTNEAKKEFHQNVCHSCGEAMSNDCERCSRLWSS